MATTKKALKAAAATSGLFEKATEQDKPKKAIPKKEQQAAGEPKRETATFSVKIETTTLKKWRLYASMNGYGDKGKLTEKAIDEYMNRHKLSPEQQAKLDALMEL